MLKKLDLDDFFKEENKLIDAGIGIGGIWFINS